MKPITSTIETITPANAAEYIKRNTINRPLRERHVNKLASEMTAGRWLTTHQGIAFDEHGNVLDGQHRLYAIVKSKRPAKMMVTRGLQSKVNGTANLFTMDVIDCGRMRSTADQLSLTHGLANAGAITSAMRAIAQACTDQVCIASPTVGQVVQMLPLFGDAAADVLTTVSGNRQVRNAASLATLTLAYKVDTHVALEFALALATGENIKRGDPVYAVREALLNRAHLWTSKEGRFKLMQVIANAIYSTLRGSSLSLAKAGAQGLDHLLSKQKANVDAVRQIFTR
jgi:hypothetical protein